LQDRWQRVQDGAGQIVLLSGEPGIGKSRLVEALKERVEHAGARCLELRCSPYSQNSALQPVIEHLQRMLHFRPDEATASKVEKLQQALGRYRFPQPETLPLFTALLSLPLPAGVPPLTLSPQRQKEKTNEALVAWLCEEANQQAVTYAWEDLHWADPSTLELLALFLGQVPTIRLLAILTYRPEFTPPWGSHSYLSQLTLSRLGRQQVREMVNHVAEQALRASTGSAQTGNIFPSDSVRPELVEGRVALPADLIDAVIARTDGVPLFVEELTKTVLESVEAGGKLDQSSLQLGIPATLQDALMARVDRLGPAKEIAQLGATIGREFNYALLQAVSPLHEEALQRGLRQLVEAELVFQSGMPPQAQYLFKHALVQDTAYQSLLKSRRQQLHQQITQVLEEQFTEVKATRPELLAHHYTEAGMTEQAIPYWQKAGENATQRSANAEAISHLKRALELLKTLPDTSERAQQELTLQIALSGPLTATKGYVAPGVEKIYSRARELCRQIGETPQLFQVLLGLFSFHIVRTECQTAQELAEQCLTLAQNVQDHDLLIEAHRALGQCLYLLGEFLSAREHLEQSIVLYGPQAHQSDTFFWTNPGVVSHSWAALTLCLLGYPDQALRRAHKALTLARGLSNTYNLATALGRTAMLHHFRQERDLMQTRAEETIALSTEHGFPFFSMQSSVLHGWTQAERGQTGVGIVQMCQGMSALRDMGVESTRPYHLALLAEVYGKAGQAAEGFVALAEALSLVENSGERFYEAELHRLKGTLTLQSKVQGPKSKIEEAEKCFLKAIDIARRQSAKSLELRAATSLARLWQQQGKQKEAHKMLSETYNWFTEGFDTKDLQEAKELLEELRD
jgi:predicted ATPase